MHVCTKIAEVNLSVFIYRLFHEDFSSILRTNPDYMYVYCHYALRVKESDGAIHFEN